jgi:hypothetical protein
VGDPGNETEWERRYQEMVGTRSDAKQTPCREWLFVTSTRTLQPGRTGGIGGQPPFFTSPSWAGLCAIMAMAELWTQTSKAEQSQQ